LSELEKENEFTNIVVNAINRVLLRELSDANPHLISCQVDYNPRIESFWCIGGLDPPDTVVTRRKNDKSLTKEEWNEPIDRWVQYLGSPILQLRQQNRLEPVWDPSIKGEVPRWNLDPNVLGYQNEHRHGTSIPGRPFLLHSILILTVLLQFSKERLKIILFHLRPL